MNEITRIIGRDLGLKEVTKDMEHLIEQAVNHVCDNLITVVYHRLVPVRETDQSYLLFGYPFAKNKLTKAFDGVKSAYVFATTLQSRSGYHDCMPYCGVVTLAARRHFLQAETQRVFRCLQVSLPLYTGTDIASQYEQEVRKILSHTGDFQHYGSKVHRLIAPMERFGLATMITK